MNKIHIFLPTFFLYFKCIHLFANSVDYVVFNYTLIELMIFVCKIVIFVTCLQKLMVYLNGVFLAT